MNNYCGKNTLFAQKVFFYKILKKKQLLKNALVHNYFSVMVNYFNKNMYTKNPKLHDTEIEIIYLLPNGISRM